MNAHERIKAILNLVKLIFNLFIWCHAIGCLWYYTCYQNVDRKDEYGNNHEWITPTEWLNYKGNEYMDKDADDL